MITHEDFIKEYRLEKSDYYQENGWLYILKLTKYSLFTRIIDKLPSKIKFTNECKSNISSKIEKIPPDVIFNNIGWVDFPNVKEISENVIFNNYGSVFLGESINIGILKKIHPSVKFTNAGNLYLRNDKIPNEIVFSNLENVYIAHVKEISENVTFENGGILRLGELEKVHLNVKFINKGDVVFSSKANKIPKGIIFNNKGNVNIPKNIKYISENVIFNNDGDVVFENQKVTFSKGICFNNKGKIGDLPFLKNIPEFLDTKKYLNKMIEQLYK